MRKRQPKQPQREARGNGAGPWAPEIPLPGRDRQRLDEDRTNRAAQAARQGGGDGEDH